MIWHRISALGGRSFTKVFQTQILILDQYNTTALKKSTQSCSNKMFFSKTHGTPLELAEFMEIHHENRPSAVGPDCSVSLVSSMLGNLEKHTCMQRRGDKGNPLCSVCVIASRPEEATVSLLQQWGNHWQLERQTAAGIPRTTLKHTFVSATHVTYVSCPDVCCLWVTSVPSPFLIQHMGSQQVFQTNVQHEKKVQEHYKPNKDIV